ncbi:MAG: hypothetical protein WEC81_01340 [Patescibacteria group bacterium]
MKRGVLIIAGLVVVLVAVFVVVTLVNRGNVVSEDKSLTVYLPFDEVKTYQKISEQFITANPGAELNFKFIDAKDAKEYEAKVVNEIADGAGPDIWVVRSDWIPKHAAKSLPYTADNENPIASAKTVIEPALVDLNIYQGELYGVPLFADSLAVIYNVDFIRAVADGASASVVKTLSQFPATWKVVQDQAALVSKKSGSVITRSAIALGTIETGYAPVDVLSAMLVQNGASVLNDDETKVAFDLAQFKDGKSSFPATEALDLFTSFARSSKSNYSWNNDLGAALEAFKAGKTGAIIGYYSLLRELVDEEPSFEIGVAALPQISTKTDRVDFGITWSHIINAQSTAPVLAKSYLSYLTQGDVQKAYIELTGKIGAAPLEQEVSDDISSPGLAASEVYWPQLKTVQQLTKKDWQRVDEILQDTVKLVINSKGSLQSAINTAAKQLEELIK